MHEYELCPNNLVQKSALRELEIPTRLTFTESNLCVPETLYRDTAIRRTPLLIVATPLTNRRTLTLVDHGDIFNARFSPANSF